MIGSQIFQMMKGVSESFAGRVDIIPMQGLSSSEINKVPSEPYTTEVSRLLSRLSVAKKMSLKEIYDLAQVADEMQFQRFLTACVTRTSQMVNYSESAKEVGISSPTAKSWLSLLTTSGIIVLVEPCFNNALKRIVKAPNVYFWIQVYVRI
ncbi:MAG: hypothetical protein CVV00_13075 [Firmicutes bacterium HGW-Firmicutes-5]|nr:MAG: hypothetical protein CVV00_13075 [Firmicutes bacterium HGW-Firmicutes-5]